MGIRLVGLALNNSWGGLSDRARVVLISMCATALDTSSAGKECGLYYKGHRALMTEVYGTDWDALDARQKAAAEQIAKRAIRELKDAGAITLVGASAYKRAATYKVHPERFPGAEPVDNSDDAQNLGVHPVTPIGVHPVTPKVRPWGTSGEHLGVHPVTPRGIHVGGKKGEEQRQDPTQPPAQLWSAAPTDLWITQ